ncbi:DUF6230 family protein [Nocardiopsis sp. EMB25]|uniref:DUF6230 family protein n=1 Tax=Nocardiopsis sp. EMB25 TaxID=2835867 RepID=UPI0022853384|nr:DUF6230 family protein [Nocardiopsis sp. EMB25]MCY9786237.1 DUF6230 family protein [Nocardiopsis sp. EMB25]
MADAPDGVPEGTPRGRTRWRRFALVALPGLGAAGLLATMGYQGLLAAAFAVSGDTIKVSADVLDARGFTQFGSFDQTIDGTSLPVAVTTMESVEIHGLCQSTLLETPLGPVTVRITAGHDEPITGSSVVFDAEEFTADVEFTNVEIGRDASTLDKAVGGQGPPGGFGQQADTLLLVDLRSKLRAITAAHLRLPDTHFAVGFDVPECF